MDARWLRWASLLAVGLLLVLVFVSAALPWLMPERNAEARHFAAIAIFAASYLALAVGKVPGLAIDRAGVALVGACLMVASGAVSMEDAYRAVDVGTITLLLGMMIIVANLRISGFFALATAWIIRHVHRPLPLLAAIVAVSGVFSAFLVNDAICLVMAPLVMELAIGLRRNPVPYLLAVALASNVGSTATITGNPQNMMIGRYGTGLRPRPSVSSSTSGAITRQIASLTRNAENTPETPTTAASSSTGWRTCRATKAFTSAKKPEMRRLATTIIMPSSKVMVPRSMAWYASSSETAPEATIRQAPTSATPARSIDSPGTLPIASAR